MVAKRAMEGSALGGPIFKREQAKTRLPAIG